MQVDFFFEPSCPWTWVTSRWLLSAAPERDLQIRFRPLSLACINEHGDVKEKHRVGQQALRLTSGLDDAARQLDVHAFYTELGSRWHEREEPFTIEVVREAAAAVGLEREAALLLDDDCWDGPIRASYREAMALAGPGVGSPIIAFGEPRRGMFGPILSPAPTGEDAVRLWDLFEAACSIDGLWEIKRGRTVRPGVTAP